MDTPLKKKEIFSNIKYFFHDTKFINIYFTDITYNQSILNAYFEDKGVSI